MNRLPGFVFGLVSCLWPVAVRADEPAEKSPASTPHVRVTISRETTFFTEPLRPDGYVDYPAALNRLYSEGVTPENNAAVLLWQAAGPGQIPEPIRNRYFEMLGIPTPPVDGDYFVSFAKFVDGLSTDELPDGVSAEDLADRETIHEQLYRACRRPWTSKRFPVVDAWLRGNGEPLELVVEASKRPRCYWPIVCDEPGSTGSLLMIGQPPRVKQVVEIARMLTAKAMRHVRHGEFESARNDLMACHRLARLVGQGGNLVNTLTGYVIDRIAWTGDVVLLHRGQFTTAQLRAWARETDGLTAHPHLADKVDVFERVMYLDILTTAACLGDQGRGAEMAERIQTLWEEEPRSPSSSIDEAARRTASWFLCLLIDWDEMLRCGNLHFDRIADAMRRPTCRERIEALRQLRVELEGWRAEFSDSRIVNRDLATFKSFPSVITERASRLLLVITSPVTHGVLYAEDLNVMHGDLVTVAVSLAAYRADQRTYPDRLDQLVPEYLDELPADIFSDSPLRYERRGAGFILYSVGVDGRDDGGKQKGSRDLVVRYRGLRSVGRAP